MTKKKKYASVVALIPAQKGTSNIPDRNIRMLGHYPLIAYSIAAGLKSSLVERVIVSTDDETTAAISRKWGADAPFIRPEDAQAESGIVLHVLDWLKERGELPDSMIILDPAFPFRSPGFVDEAIKMLMNTQAGIVRSVSQAGGSGSHLWRMKKYSLIALLNSGSPEGFFIETGHGTVIRPAVVLEKKSLPVEGIIPFVISDEYLVKLNDLPDWRAAETLIPDRITKMVVPVPVTGSFTDIRLIVSDFDGVMTDDRVWVDQTGRESVICSRSDGMGVSLLKNAGVPVVVLSTEENPVVKARCDKLQIPCYQGVRNKAASLYAVLKEYQVNLEQVAYIGNDVNDLECMERVGLAVAVADAHQEVKRTAHCILDHPGGHGAFRELVEKIIEARKGPDLQMKVQN